MGDGACVIDVTGVSKAHSSGILSVAALVDVGFEIREGEFVAIMGPSGSGKTTLLGILGCLDRPTAGSYRLLGEDVTTLDEAERARVRRDRIGFVFQAYNLIPRSSAFRNVELPLIYSRVPSAERRERALEALAEVGLSERADHRPSQLSGGEQQRVAIARALVVRPTVVLADEPTGNLDSASAEDVLAILDRVHRRGATIVLVTHSDEVGRRASRIIRLADGRIVSDLPAAPEPALELAR